MVMARAARALRADFQKLRQSLEGPIRPPPGLLTYRFAHPDGHTRLHLRVQADGTGLLFRDVTDVLHLTESAAFLAWLALEELPERQAVRALKARFHGDRTRMATDYRRMRHVIQTLADPHQTCSPCALDLPKLPLFSERARAPHKVDVALTYACNNKCPHCYNDPSRFDLQSMPTGDWKRVLDRLATVGVPHIIFTGGEATLHPGLPELIAHADGLGQIVGLNSNGRRLTHRPYMRSLEAAGLNHVQVTLESHIADVHDAMVGARAFHQTVDGVRSALETRCHVITNSTITRQNQDSIEETVLFLHELGLTTFAMNGMIYSGGGDQNPDAIPQEELPAILIKVRDTAEELGMRFLWYTVTEYCEMSPLELEIGAKRCNAGEYSMCVEPNGDVLPCQSYYVSAGNLLRDPWEQIYHGELFRSFRDREEHPRWAGLPDKCHPCPDLPVCGGGCRIEREARDGTAPEASGCQSCASGGTGRSSGRSASAVLHAEASCTCAPPPGQGLVTLRIPGRETLP